MNVWLVMIAAGLLTYGLRLSFIFLFGQREVHPRLLKALGFVPPAVLSAIILPEVFFREGALALGPSNLRLWSALIASLVAWYTRSVLLTILSGMIALLALQFITSLL